MNKMKIEISDNFGQDKERAKIFGDELTEILKPLQERGLISFERKSYRKCDYCQKKLEAGDKFKTIGDKDMCEDCQYKIKKRIKKDNIPDIFTKEGIKRRDEARDYMLKKAEKEMKNEL